MKLKNISGGQIVCDLADGKVLRLNNNQSVTFSDNQITKHIKNLVTKGLLMSVVEQPAKTVEKPVKKRKEETQDGSL